MSVFNWLYDLDQESRLNEQQQQIEQMQKKIDILEQWVRYFQEKIEEQQ